jgi:capsular polysaccharide transport system permease protein
LSPRKPLQIFKAVQYALFFRELGMKTSIGRLGFFWLFFEPFAQVSFFIFIRVVLMGRGVDSNFDYAVFMAVGFIAFNMFKSILSGATGAFSANKGLFNYKQVKPIDTILGRVLLQVFITSIIVIIFLFLGFILGYSIEAENILLVVMGYIWLLTFSFSVGLVVAVGNTFYTGIGKTVSIVSFGLLIFSAVFFPLISLPTVAQDILLYNPLVHFMEMIHGAYIPELDDRFVDYRYMFLWTVTPLFVGTWLYIRLEKKIISQ